ncbi:hypothetical protein PR202_gb05971 [Eleusine coracana subsp. coracana]|uniref:F-box domain-containing protein n=1 Tax=Eleusine coracana subsp. coracana TaxID=191504 RepID=A0AAV5E8P1_ELECO|nr:hypothetical protein PR202_gb05971 [Eleusine coracana subsp. coracana]
MGRKRKRSPDLLEEIVIDILARLPVKDLLKYKSVCKAWRKIISDPTFIKAHLRFSASKWKQDPCFTISPHVESTRSRISNHIRFYQWNQGASGATFLHDKIFGYEFNRVRGSYRHQALPLQPGHKGFHHSSTQQSQHLVASWKETLLLCRSRPRSIYRQLQGSPGFLPVNGYMGMEVLTVAGGNSCAVWREIMDDPPYPAERSQTSLSVKGFMFWHIDKALSE